MVGTFNGNPIAAIISCYSLTNVSEETDLINFYNELSSLFRSILKHNVLVIGGNKNAETGKEVNHKLDDIFINKRWNNSVLNCEAYIPLSMMCPPITDKDTTKLTKECDLNGNNRTLWLVPT